MGDVTGSNELALPASYNEIEILTYTTATYGSVQVVRLSKLLIDKYIAIGKSYIGMTTDGNMCGLHISSNGIYIHEYIGSSGSAVPATWHLVAWYR